MLFGFGGFSRKLDEFDFFTSFTLFHLLARHYYWEEKRWRWIINQQNYYHMAGNLGQFTCHNKDLPLFFSAYGTGRIGTMIDTSVWKGENIRRLTEWMKLLLFDKPQ